MANYARLLACSEKSLGRATQEFAGVSAKSFLSQRIALEPMRLLVHTDETIAEIPDMRGFDEATNFVKYFRREAGHAPREFRDQHHRRDTTNSSMTMGKGAAYAVPSTEAVGVPQLLPGLRSRPLKPSATKLIRARRAP